MKTRKPNIEYLEDRFYLSHPGEEFITTLLPNVHVDPPPVDVDRPDEAGLPMPVLNSMPGAPATIFLDFDGDFVQNWYSWSNITIPPYDIDGVPSSLSQSEVNIITSIWQVVSQDYMPWNINVTTVDPRTINNYNGMVSQIDIGGNSSWTGGSYGGLGALGGLQGTSANNPIRGFVFPNNIGTNPAWLGNVTTHESGHNMNLQHQSLWSGSTKVAEYYSGPGDGTSPSMGYTYNPGRSMWWYGTNTYHNFQNDVDVITANGFGYRSDEAGSTVTTASPLTVNGDAVNNLGLIIGNMNDVDAWSFTTDAGTISLNVSIPTYSDLHPKIRLLTSTGSVVLDSQGRDWIDPDTGNMTWTGVVTAGSYRLMVASHGISVNATSTNYGFDIGTYDITGTIVTPADIIATPTDLTAIAISTSQINLSWTDNANNETGYTVERSSNGGNTWSQVAILDANSNTHSDQGLTSNTTYVYRVRAFNGDTVSDYSNIDNATTEADIPATPTDLTAIAASPTEINLSWTDNANNETGYTVERSSNGGNTWSQVASLAANSSNYTNQFLQPGVTYSYRVRAINGTATSEYSNTATATTPLDLPNAPSNLTAVRTSPNQILLSWTDNSTNEDGFYVERVSFNPNGKQQGNWVQIAIVRNSQTTYIDPVSVSGRKSYSYRVRAFNSSGTSAYSNTTPKVYSLVPIPIDNSTPEPFFDKFESSDIADQDLTVNVEVFESKPIELQQPIQRRRFHAHETIFSNWDEFEDLLSPKHK